MSFREVVLQGHIALVDTGKSVMSQRLRVRLVLATAALLPAVAHCTGRTSPKGTASSSPPPSSSHPPETPSAAPSASAASATSGDGGAPYAGPYIGSIVLQAPVMSEMEWPGNHKAD